LFVALANKLITGSCWPGCGIKAERWVLGSGLDVLSLKGQKVNYLSLLMVHNSHKMGKLIRGYRKK